MLAPSLLLLALTAQVPTANAAAPRPAKPSLRVGKVAPLTGVTPAEAEAFESSMCTAFSQMESHVVMCSDTDAGVKDLRAFLQMQGAPAGAAAAPAQAPEPDAVVTGAVRRDGGKVVLELVFTPRAGTPRRETVTAPGTGALVVAIPAACKRLLGEPGTRR